MSKTISIEEINALLPQTQCGLCGYQGCKPYAEALANGKAAINLCPPGGVDGLTKIGELLGVDPKPFLSDMEQSAKPRLLAKIREQDCIGCMKCIKACPVDAILGSAKHMHTVIASECTGCELCVAPCPVDCIDIIPIGEHQPFRKEESDYFRKRHEAQLNRLNKNTESPKQKKSYTVSPSDHLSYIQAALLRKTQG